MANTRFIMHHEERTHELDGSGEGLASACKVLLLDDEAEFANMVKVFLETSGPYHVTVAGDGVQGIKQIMAMDFDIILCDMIMPNLAGDMFYRAVERTRPHLCKRFIFMTGHQGNAKINEFIRQVHGLIMWKPFELHTLIEAIQVIIKKNPPPANS